MMNSYKLLTIAAWAAWFIGAVMVATEFLWKIGVAVVLTGGVCMAVRGKKPKDNA